MDETRDREGVENVSIEDVDGDGPFAGVQPNAGGDGTVDDGEVLSVIGDNDVLRKDPTTDSVCEGDSTGLRGGEGRWWRHNSRRRTDIKQIAIPSTERAAWRERRICDGMWIVLEWWRD